ncbi:MULTISPECIES: hypothetical protein [Streptomyces rochei group]|uniref:hypothetical protein n=1 Tax=Streptomyces rochei group TaxID=2867164 RepID=UPI001876F681|nr:hypothetical protein [Streptomyces vinaceusdrappus]GHC37401.1 hypothetical protein GCM10010308_64980 [Streptomyces vinaceusdrappus]
MSEWNLSVRLTGQGSDLASTLRDSAKEARKLKNRIKEAREELALLRTAAADDITVRLDIDAGHLRTDVTNALTAAGSGQGLAVRLDLDADHLRDEVTAALTTAGGQSASVRLDVDAGDLRTDAEAAIAAATAGLNITVGVDVDDASLDLLRSNSRDTAHSLNTLQRAARDAKNELEELETRALTTATAIRRIATAAGRAQTRLDTMSGSTRQFRTDLDDLDGSLTTVIGRIGDLRGHVGGLGGGSGGGGGAGLGRLGLQSLITLAPAAIPLAAGLTSNVAPLGPAFAAAGFGATAFGVALAGQIGPLSEAADAEKKYQEAVRDHGASSAEAMEAQLAYQKQLSALPPETQRASVALSTLKQEFGDWSDDMASFTMEPVTKGFVVLQSLLPHLSPEVESFSGSLDRLMTVAGGAIQTPGFDAISDRVAEFTDATLDDFTDQVIHLLRVVSQGDADAGALGQILAYMRENGPAAREALNAIGDAVGNLFEAASIAGPSMLTLVTAAANLVAALPPELVAIILQTAAALKILQLAGAGMAVVAGGVAAVRAQLATLAAASAAAGGGLAGLRAAFLALGTAAKASVVVAGIAALVLVLSELSEMGKQAPPDVDKLTSSLRELGSTGKVTGEAAKAFGKDLDGLYDRVRSLTDPSTTDDVQQWITTIGGLGDWDSTPVKEAKETIDAIDKSLSNLVKSGQADLAAQALQKLTAEYGKGGRDTSQFTKQLDDYKSALADAKFEQELAAQAMGLFGQAAQDTSAKLAAQKASADGLRQSIVALNDVNRAAGSAMSAFEQSIDDATAAVKEHGSALKMRDGELDLGSQKARDAEKVLSELAANTDAAATAAREQGRSWEYVSSIQERGRDAFVQAASAMGLSKAQAEALADSYLKIPDSKTTRIEMRTEDAIAGLDSVIAAIKRTPGAKSVTVSALTSDAIALLEQVGFTVKRLPDGRFTVTADTATAKQRLSAVQAARDGLKNKTITISARDAASAAAAAAKAAIDKVRSKQVTITARYQTIGIQGSAARANAKMMGYADGGVVDFYANGGIRPGRVSFFANGSDPGDQPNQHQAQIAPAGSYRVWGERETQGEGYVPFRRSARPRSRRITEEIVARLGGDPRSIDWYADGGLSGWQYDPVSGSLYSPSDAIAAGRKTKKVRTKVKGKWTTKDVEYFDLAAVERKLWQMGEATAAWNRNLEKVADRAGGDVAKALAGMGDEGMKLAEKMAKGTNKYVASMSIALRGMMQEARASLKDFTLQLDHATGNNQIFQNNLIKLASMGYGDLASQLASQNNEAAHDLAASAVDDRRKAAKANSAVSKAKAQLTSDQMADLIQIIAAISSKTTGIHDVAGKTGLGEDVIIEIANKAKAQISKSLGSKATKFLADLGKANKGLAYADGGIRAGIYATRGGLVRFAEPETHGEAYLPLSPSKRRTALPVLADVANRFGVGLTDAAAGRPVVIVKHGDSMQVTVTPVRTGASATDIAAQVGRSWRRARRGGVAARAA